MKKFLTALALVSALGLTACNDTNNTTSLNENQQAFLTSQLIQSDLVIFVSAIENVDSLNGDFEDVVLSCDGGGTVTLNGSIALVDSALTIDTVATYDNCVMSASICDLNFTLDGTVSSLMTTDLSTESFDSTVTINDNTPLTLTANGDDYTIVGSDFEYFYDGDNDLAVVTGGDVVLEDGSFEAAVINDRTVSEICTEF